MQKFYAHVLYKIEGEYYNAYLECDLDDVDDILLGSMLMINRLDIKNVFEHIMEQVAHDFLKNTLHVTHVEREDQEIH